VATVSSDFWDLAGATPELGRLPSPSEDAIVLSHAFFESAFNGDTTPRRTNGHGNDRRRSSPAFCREPFRSARAGRCLAAVAGRGRGLSRNDNRPPAPTDFGVRLFYVIAGQGLASPSPR